MAAPFIVLESPEELRKRLLPTLSLPENVTLLTVQLNANTVPRSSTNTARLQKQAIQRNTFYFVVAQDGNSGEITNWGYVSHEALDHLNKLEMHCWNIPREYCIPELNTEVADEFSYYQMDTDFVQHKLEVCVEKELTRWFGRRKFLAHWFQQTTEYRDRHAHELEDLNATFTDYNGSDYDNLCFYLLATTVDPNDDAYNPWMEAEIATIRHCILKFPGMATRICQLQSVASSTPVTHALDVAREFVTDTVNKIRALAPIRAIPVTYRRLARAHLTDLLVAVMDSLREKKLAQRAADFMRPPLRGGAKVDERTEMKFGDIRGCAPRCMEKLMMKALGSDQDKAAMPKEHREMLTSYWLDMGLDSSEINLISRPKIMIEYESLPHQQSWSTIQKATKSQEETRRRMIELKERDEYMPCADVIRAGLCGFQGSNPTKRLTKEEYKDFLRTRNVNAHRQCQVNLKDLHRTRKSQNRSCGGPVTPAWILSPAMFSRVAFYGEGHNEDKKAWIQKREAEKAEVTPSAATTPVQPEVPPAPAKVMKPKSALQQLLKERKKEAKAKEKLEARAAAKAERQAAKRAEQAERDEEEEERPKKKPKRVKPSVAVRADEDETEMTFD